MTVKTFTEEDNYGRLFQELHQNQTVCLTCSLEQITIPIWEPVVEVWAVYGPDGFDRAIHNIENAPFRTKFERICRK